MPTTTVRRAAVAVSAVLAAVAAGCAGGTLSGEALDVGDLTSSEPPATTVAEPATTVALRGERVARVVDGDTLEMADGAKVRLIGIDTPERGQPCYREATEHLRSLVDGRDVVLRGGARDDSDRYGRLLRYVDVQPGDVDANLEMIRAGYAVARYDSRDGYGHHLREDAYVAADAATEHRCAATGAAATAAPTAPGAGGGDPRFATCKDAKAAGYGPYRAGQVEYGWYRDGDGDGLVCE